MSFAELASPSPSFWYDWAVQSHAYLSCILLGRDLLLIVHAMLKVDDYHSISSGKYFLINPW